MSVVLTGLKFIMNQMRETCPLISLIFTDSFCISPYQSVGLNLFSHKFHKYTRILSVLISANLWAISQILSFSDSQIQKRRHSVTSLLADLVLQHKDFLLSFNLTTQFFFCRHKSQISRCIKLIITVKNRIMRHVFVCICT